MDIPPKGGRIIGVLEVTVFVAPVYLASVGIVR